MRKEEKYKEEVERTRLVSVTCDVCKKEFDNDNWDERGHGSELETSVYYKVGVSDYDGGGQYTKWTIDICPECFSGKLMPTLKEIGVEFRLEELTW